MRYFILYGRIKVGCVVAVPARAALVNAAGGRAGGGGGGGERGGRLRIGSAAGAL